ncbi:MAG: NifB/NifX family molybdenum-iron cluster-binding protein [Armatimonadota bacterium]
MRYAIATDGEHVAPHFGRCEKYTLVDIEGGEPAARQELLNPGHEPGRLPRLLDAHGVDRVVAGGAGQRAVTMLSMLEIGVCVGVTGTVDEAIREIASGELEGGENICEH